MEWKKEYRVGIHDVDEQHKTLIECITSIEQAVAQYDRQSADSALDRLAELTQAHFALEESLMRTCDYPLLDAHADHHEQFSVHLNTLRERFIPPDVFRDRINCLHEWWDTHVQQHDKSYALHFLKYTVLGKPSHQTASNALRQPSPS
jgi:hemerythrin